MDQFNKGERENGMDAITTETIFRIFGTFAAEGILDVHAVLVPPANLRLSDR